MKNVCGVRPQRLTPPAMNSRLSSLTTEALMGPPSGPNHWPAKLPVRVLRRPGRLGLATAVLDGWAMARGDVLGVLDADLQHPPETLTALAAAIQQGADLAIGSRYVPGAARRTGQDAAVHFAIRDAYGGHGAAPEAGSHRRSDVGNLHGAGIGPQKRGAQSFRLQNTSGSYCQRRIIRNWLRFPIFFRSVKRARPSWAPGSIGNTLRISRVWL